MAASPEHLSSLVLDERRALVAIPAEEDGRALVRYIPDDEAVEVADERSVREALALAGAWSDLDWDAMERELHRIGHQTPPTPPIDES